MTRGQPVYNRLVNRRGCPGSYATVTLTADEQGICPYCANLYPAKRSGPVTGVLRAHPRPR